MSTNYSFEVVPQDMMQKFGGRPSQISLQTKGCKCIGNAFTSFSLSMQYGCVYVAKITFLVFHYHYQTFELKFRQIKFPIVFLLLDSPYNQSGYKLSLNKLNRFGFINMEPNKRVD